MKFYHVCDMLINQHLYIVREDGQEIPLEHRCWNKAEWEYQEWLICEECYQQFVGKRISRLKRITIPAFVGRDDKYDMLKMLLKKEEENIYNWSI